jgi:small subunit ribosomal protein S20
MTHSKQAAKRVRQNEKRRLRNKARVSALKSVVKKVMAAVEKGDKPAVQALLPFAIQTIDKAAKGGAIAKNTAARRKSLVMRAASKMQ